MTRISLATLVGLVALTSAASVPMAGCSKKEAEESAAPAPSAAAPTAPTATAVPTVVAPVVPPPVVNTKVETESIKGCCAALHGEEGKAAAKDKAPLLQAASVCDGIAALVSSGKTKKADALTSIRAAMKNGALPSACH